MSQTEKQELSPEQQEKLKRWEQDRAKRAKELTNVLNFLQSNGMKIHKGLMMRTSSIDYFRAVNFHVGVLALKDKILAMIPTFIKEGSIKKLETIDDSVALGQQMLEWKIIIQLRKDPGLVHANEKIPKFVVPTPPDAKFTEKGIFHILDTTTQSTQTFYLAIVVIVILALMCFRLWPMWLKKGIWYVSFYLLVFLIVTAIVRVILWGILYHFGLEFWLFPNYFIDSNDPRDSFWPLTSFEIREDCFDYKSIIFRIISGSLIVYMGYQFLQDEKNIQDLQDLSENGLSDLFEYGLEFVVGGNALGDGKLKDDNSTKKQDRQETFAEKYRKELKKDFNDLEDDEEIVEEQQQENTEQKDSLYKKLFEDDDDDNTDSTQDSNYQKEIKEGL